MSDSYSPKNKERIDAVESTHILQSDPKTSKNTIDTRGSGLFLWIGLVILLLLVITVIFLLPKAINNKSDLDLFDTTPPKPISSEQVAKAISQESTGQEVQQQIKVDDHNEQIQTKVKEDAEGLLARLIEIEKNLQSHAVIKWAPEEYAQAVDRGRIGDEYYRRKQYTEAIEEFKIAITQLEEIEQRVQPTLERALVSGEEALKQANQDVATQQFELAQAIEPNNIRAKQGLQRASTIKELFEILQRASRFESHGQLQEAMSAYQQAVTLDPLSEEAKSSLARVDSKLKDEEFNQLIATGYKALQETQYSDARTAFNSARAIKPDSNKPEIGLKKVANAVRQEKISNLIYEANHYTELQDWQNAATSYEKVLQLSNNHQQAQQGLQESLTKAKITSELKETLASTDELYKDEVLEKAEHLLRSIEELQSPGSIIESQYEELKQHVSVATTPISITLESDRNTQVTVYRVAKLGTFSRHQLQLRPGPYTIVGSRTGYRDVRLTIEVSPESNNSTILIRCEEPI